MSPIRSVRTVALLVAVALVGGVFMVVPQGARADANGPRWTSGDFWSYVDTDDPDHTLRVDVVGQGTARTLLGNTYSAFHVKETETTGSFGLTTDFWIRHSDLAIVNSSVTLGVLFVTTYDPPRPQAIFPLSALKSWTVSLNVSVKVGNGGVNTASASMSAQVEGETDIVVPAGTFRSFAIRGLGGGDYSKLYYSEQAGYWSKKEEYNAQDQRTEEMVLSSHRYQWNTTFLLIVIGVVILAAIAIAAFVTLRRRRARTPPPGTPPAQPPDIPPPPGP